jgi:hypothetical protein
MIKISRSDAKKIGKFYNINFNIIDEKEWHYGLNVELEHGTKFGKITNITNNNIHLTAKIAIAHLIESPDYYKRLKKMEDSMDKYWKYKQKPSIFN